MKAVTLLVASAMMSLLPASAISQSREEIAKSLADLSKTAQTTASFMKLYQLHNQVLGLTRLQTPSPPMNEVQLGEEIEFGNAAAPEIAVVFLDPECTHCMSSSDFIAGLAKPGAANLRVVVRFIATSDLLKDSANVLLHCLYDRSPSIFPQAFGHIHRNQPKSQEELRKFATMAGLSTQGYEQCLGGTKAMERILHIYRYNIALFESCPSIGCWSEQNTKGQPENTIGVPLAIFGANPQKGSTSFKISGYKAGADWWRQ